MTISPTKTNIVGSSTNMRYSGGTVDQRERRAGEANCVKASSGNDTSASASYVQVVVQKCVRGARLPKASSPEPLPPQKPGYHGRVTQMGKCYHHMKRCGAGAAQAHGAVAAERGCATCATLYSCVVHHHDDVAAAGAGDAWNADICGAQPPSCAPGYGTQHGEKRCRGFWTRLTQTKKTDGPDRIEVYQFGAAGAVCARRGDTRVERCARPLGRRLAELLDELLAVPRLLLPIPILVVLRVQSCVLLTVRDVISEAARSVSELALTPALAVLHEAVLRPPLLCAARTAASLREAVRPLWLLLGDATAPVAHLLAQTRLVHVKRDCACVRNV